MIKIAPSLLAADFSCLREELDTIKSAEWLHLDVMDGHFVQNLTFGPGLIKAIRPYSKQQFDTHLMIEDPARYVDVFIEAGSNHITFHVEAVSNPLSLIEHIHARGVKAGLSLRPATPVEVLADTLPFLDLVLVMSVEPGFGGQAFIPESLEKIRWLAQVKTQRQLNYEIVVDGGIDDKTAALCQEAGATVLVAGSYVFGAKDREAALGRMRHGR
ncbi:MAG: ribulose-phosphate 3-epimerase [Acholeplasmatales bacterium]|nr:MAG: ribulose-phosphate 3-epimerase [Acholeplasmatales bacterium]